MTARPKNFDITKPIPELQPVFTLEGNTNAEEVRSILKSGKYAATATLDTMNNDEIIEYNFFDLAEYESYQTALKQRSDYNRFAIDDNSGNKISDTFCGVPLFDNLEDAINYFNN